LLGWLVLLAILYALFVWRLGTLTPGFSVIEFQAREASQSLQAIANNPISAPHKIIQHGLQALGHNGAFWMRSASVLWALIILICLYQLLKIWFGRLIGFMGVVLFASTPLFILNARSATPTILWLTPIIVITAYVWLVKTDHWPNLAWITLCLVSALAVYAPGVVWLVLAGVIFGRRRLMGKFVKVSDASLAAGVTLFILVALPLVLASVRDPSIVRQLFLVPASWPGLEDILESIGWAISALFWKTRNHIDTIIGRVPVLSATQIILSVLGAYALFKRARREAIFLILVVVISVLGIGLGQPTEFIILALTTFGLLAAAGLRYLFYEWQSTFPFNPIPRALALFLISALVGLHVVYGARYSLLAWPNTVETKSTYVLK
jgi:4-amino-4-deoxy-L-arabinose transferase-like glycosyltransferase